MVPEKTTTQPEVAETTLPGACMVCGGDLHLKVSAGHKAVSFCSTCHWLGKPEVTATFNGLKVLYKPSGAA